MINTESLIKELTQRNNDTLHNLLQNLEDNQLHQALKYTCLTPGKRFRPLLVYATGLSFGADEQLMDHPAAAIEMIHNYSLIHDDLPIMDDDDMRHGQPSCHKKFSEATAILAGDALLAYAFEIVTTSDNNLSAQQQVGITRELARACGPYGITLGQHLDMSPEDATSLSEVENIHYHKTATLIQASMVIGALCSSETALDQSTIEQLRLCGSKLGLAYQIQDDVLDLISSSEHLGKTANSDTQNHKHTYSIVAGIDKSTQHAQQLYSQALQCLDACGLKDSQLEQLVEYFSRREQ